MRFPSDEMVATSWVRIKRAHERLLLAAMLGVGTTGLIGTSWSIVVGIAVAAAVIAFRFSTWKDYVLHGAPPHVPDPPAEFAEPGDRRVVLLAPGRRWIEVVKVVREVRDLELAPAKAMVYSVPSIVAPGVSQASAERVDVLLRRAGAVTRVEVEEPDDAVSASD